MQLRSIAMYVPEQTEQLIIDAPAGASGLVLQEMLDRASCLIVPVPPSPIDIHATANFVSEVLNTVRMQSRKLPVAIVANKVRRSMPQYAPFDGFLHRLNLSLLARLVDSDVYVKAAEAGIGVFEMEPGLALAERRQFTPIVEWVQSQGGRRAEAAEGEVVELARRLA
jgi:chromosome partitioning protein